MIYKKNFKEKIILKTIAMPSNINVNGHIFGGWILSKMDLGGAILAKKITQSKVATVCVKKVSFLKFINVGDIITCYAKCLKTGKSSIAININLWITNIKNKKFLAAKGIFIYVAIDDLGKPNPVFLKK